MDSCKNSTKTKQNNLLLKNSNHTATYFAETMFSSSRIMKFIKRDLPLLNSLKKCYSCSHSLYVKPMDAKIFSGYVFYKYQHRKHMLQFYEKLITIHSVKYSSSSKSPDEAKQETEKTKANDAASATDPEGKPSSLFDTTKFKDAVIKVLPKKNENLKIELPLLSKERNFLTAIRAMSEFLLSPEDLEDLRKTNRRSPFENEPPITVYWRKDVESKAIKVWGSLEVLEKEKQKRDRDMKNYQEYLFQLKKKKNPVPPTPTSTETFREKLAMDSSGKVVWTAVIM
ncbi:hypothetical protein Anas_05857 [Armadillidium nasatum]|uniref:Uncharacterized protein n=1 Tax=Armadillidium nasatum TaxID=96803 RepID=A0A5N5T3L4_9CRUS|nr:hypothetical protein Anas_05857 [Armadillidium nasatum]